VVLGRCTIEGVPHRSSIAFSLLGSKLINFAAEGRQS
jgi:hypothetical protein